MTTYVLNSETPETKEFTFKGDCCICAEGSGSIQVLREMENKFVPVTDQKGVPLSYAASNGVAFNGHISCNVRGKYKIRATGEMIVTVVTEK